MKIFMISQSKHAALEVAERFEPDKLEVLEGTAPMRCYLNRAVVVAEDGPAAVSVLRRLITGATVRTSDRDDVQVGVNFRPRPVLNPRDLTVIEVADGAGGPPRVLAMEQSYLDGPDQ